MNIIDGTTQFHTLAVLPTNEWLEGVKTGKGFRELRELRQKLLEEEYKEYSNGEDDNDLIEVVDGLLDIIVIAWGTLLAYVGEERAKRAALEVVRSNLSKVDGTLGSILRREDGKLLKPPGWTGPDIAKALFQ